MLRALRYVAAVALTIVLNATAHASIQFDVGANNAPEAVTAGGTGNRWLIGTGYGIDGSETSGATLLDVRFDISDLLGSVAFMLTNPGDMNTFSFGTIDLQETNAGGGIVAAETDNLSLTAFLALDLPSAVAQVSSTVIPVAGSVSDAATDYTVTFSPVVVPFAGGTFQLDLVGNATGSSALVFNGTGAQAVDAKLTLLTVTQEPGIVPELPSGVVWLALGACMSGLGWVKRAAVTSAR